MIAAYAAVYWDGTPETQFVLSKSGNYVERIMPGAFDEAIHHDVVGLFNHDPSLVLGRTSAGTMRLRANEVGLRYEIDPADTQVYRDVQEHMARGDVIGSSFGFVATQEKAARDGDMRVREIYAVQLRDVGPVTWPAYPATESRDRLAVRVVSRSNVCLGSVVRQSEVVESRAAYDAQAAMSDAVDVRARVISLDRYRIG